MICSSLSSSRKTTSLTTTEGRVGERNCFKIHRRPCYYAEIFLCSWILPSAEESAVDLVGGIPPNYHQSAPGFTFGQLSKRSLAHMVTQLPLLLVLQFVPSYGV
jgi:hypothetical protein